MRIRPGALIPAVPARVEHFAPAATGSIQIASANANRVALAVSFFVDPLVPMPGGEYAQVFLRWGSEPSAGNGFVLRPEHPFQLFDFRNYGEALAADWYAFFAASVLELTVHETEYRPRRFLQSIQRTR